MGLFDFIKRKLAPVSPVSRAPSASEPIAVKNINPENHSPDNITGRLERAGYFKYNDIRDLPRLKHEIGLGLARDGQLSFVAMASPESRGLDRRYYWLDNEDLFEELGMQDMLQTMNPFFEQLRVQMVITDHVEEYDSKNQWVDQSLSINGKPYQIFHHFKGYGWGEAAQRFTEMINDQLSSQQCDERLYLVNSGNDGRAIFLTSELYTLLREYISDPNERPLTTKEFCQINNVEFFTFD